MGWTHDLTRWTIQNIPMLNPWIAKLDTFLGYGKQESDWKWWFDFEAGKDEIHIARNSQDNDIWQK